MSETIMPLDKLPPSIRANLSVYNMCTAQLAQVDCRQNDCACNAKGQCHNIAPAITLNSDGTFVCWSKKVIQ